jgi:hypothetical protein
MTNEAFYTYPEAYETKIFPNMGGGITIRQCEQSYEREHLILLSLDQSRWLLDRLSMLIKQIESADGNDNEPVSETVCQIERKHP